MIYRVYSLIPAEEFWGSSGARHLATGGSWTRESVKQALWPKTRGRPEMPGFVALRDFQGLGIRGVRCRIHHSGVRLML